MHSLYPKIKPNQTEYLSIGEHKIYVEESGNPDGIPVIYLHGGPGGGSSSDHRRYFNPEKYRIIIFDQRGCGKSTPHASTSNNTTWDLIDDIEEIREYFSITKWLVAGGSWGTTLGLAYGIKHSDRVTGFILRGIFLGTDEETAWLYGKDGAGAIYPDHYLDFIAPIKHQHFSEPVKTFHKLLTSDNEIARIAAAKAWTLWETRISALQIDKSDLTSPEETHGAIAMACLENHYFINQCFFEPDFIIKNIAKIEHLPGFIIHGRYDMVCQLKQAHILAQHWSNAQLQIIPKSGHSGFEVAIIDAICQASDKMAAFIESQ
ncbi:prolyl aminopeptidase [Thalassotalea psychrophila]|uniref:Proline iminopeptidase n=1 Tax=Thalassotalea psychrophila TaxID=3065647 RepID=A0ABY9TSP6_9GAMM|nr:prolyl aminopeptidase [Colwelliaceae bacterium SQ149]